MSSAGDNLDVVITWVNGSDPEWQSQLDRHKPRLASREHAADGPRFRDSGLLKYVLRSVERNFRGLRRIWLVTNGQVPDWLKQDSHDLSVVSHEQIFPILEDLPTFNSMAIECHLHRIPGVSRRFVYLNDDVMLLRETSPDYFLVRDKGHAIFLEDFPMPVDPTRGETSDRSLAFTGLLLNQRYGSLLPGLLIAHGPQVYDCRWIEELWKIWPIYFERTSRCRFRQTDCVALRYLYYYSIIHCPIRNRPAFAMERTYPVKKISEVDQFLLRLNNDYLEICRQLTQIDIKEPRFICVNDDEMDPVKAGCKLEIVHKWLESRFPMLCRWELPD